ncbi:hypothetical protein NMG60_11005199 [Bertholletia excelsa]
MELLLICLFLASLLFFLTIQKPRKHGALPGPSGLPFIGNLHQLDASNLHRHLWQLSKDYGPIFSLKLGFRSVLVVSSAEMAKEILKTNDVLFSDRPPFISHQIMSRNGLDLSFANYGEYWREMRKICAIHLFSSKRVHSFSHIRNGEIARMIKNLSQFASDAKLANMSEILFSHTSSVICRIAFSRRYDEEGSARSKFHSLLNEVQAVVGSFYYSDYFPYMGWLDKLTGRISRIHKTFKELDLFLQERIDEHLDNNKRVHNGSDKEDITDVLLQMRGNDSFKVDLTVNHIKAVIMDIFVAGTDTSAATLVWGMTELMRNPRVMKKLQEEVRGLNDGEKAVINDGDLQNLPYLKAVVKETLRLHPPAPLMVPHYTYQKCNVGGYEIKPDTMVHVNVWAVGRDPKHWEKPEEFWPERFLGNPIDFRGQDFEFIPFGAGRRSCPGINLGALTVELALANLAYSFDWKLPEGMKEEDIDMDVRPGIAMHKKNELCLLPKNYSGVKRLVNVEG